VHTDKLRAIARVSNKIQKLGGGEYLAGLWKQDIAHQLLWHIFQPSTGLAPRPHTFIAPTWSWASVPNRVMHEDAVDRCNNFEVLDCNITLLYETEPLGPVISGSLTVKGRLKHASYIIWGLIPTDKKGKSVRRPTKAGGACTLFGIAEDQKESWETKRETPEEANGYLDTLMTKQFSCV
jgi:hypothetical protein